VVDADIISSLSLNVTQECHLLKFF
jgi:hypothetical protein